MQWDYKGNEYSPNIISVETVEGHPQPESNQRVEFPKIIPVDYNSDDYYSGDSDSEYMMAIQGNYFFLFNFREFKGTWKIYYSKEKH